MSKRAVIAKITALPGLRDEVAAVLSQMVKATHDEPGTLQYTMNFDTANADVIWFYEVYDNDASFAAHGGSETMKAVGMQLRDKAAGRPEINVLDLVDGKNVP